MIAENKRKYSLDEESQQDNRCELDQLKRYGQTAYVQWRNRSVHF